MKRFLVVLMATMILMGCKKDELKIAPLANVNVINAILEGKVLKLNDYLRDSVAGFNGKKITVKSGQIDLNLYPSDRSASSYFRGNFSVVTGGLYSLYLSGSAPVPDTMFVKENIPPYFNDSTIGIRLVNLCTDSGPISLTLASDASKNLFTNLSYRGVTGFLRLPLPDNVSEASVTYQIRSADKTLLASFVLPAYESSRNPYLNISVPESRNKNLTLVLKGLKGITSGTNAIGLFPVANY